MKYTLFALLIAWASVVANAEDKHPHAKSDAHPRDGEWKPVAAMLAGNKLPQLALDAITLTVSGKNYEVAVRGEKVPDRGTHTLDENTNPKRITITSTSGPNRGKTFLGIYEMKDKDSMTACYDLSGTAFPTKFESTSETRHYLVEYQRAVTKAPVKVTDATEDAKAQNGDWNPAGAMLGGTKLSQDELKKITLTIKNGSYQVVIEGEPQADIGTVKLDTSTTPKRMTIQGIEGPNKGKTILAIYEMGERDGIDTFRVCYDLSGKAFPEEFISKKGSTHYLVGYHRPKASTQPGSESKSDTHK
jgi:RNA polymerase sigma-70 factor (ECF subfamily)